MSIHTADAIVLRQYPFRETSVLVTCLTDRFGKLKGLIKGLRGPASRHRSAMEPLTLNRIVFYDTRTSPLHLITQCELLEGFAQVQQDLFVAQTAAACAELADVVIEPGEPQPTIFRLLAETLERLAFGTPPGPAAIRIHFVLRVLRIAGFQPQLDECTMCTRRLSMNGFWSPRQGGVLCEACLHEDPKAAAMPAAWFEALSALSAAEDPEHVDPRQTTIVQHRLDEFLRWRLDRPLKALRMTDRRVRITEIYQSEITNPKSEISTR